MENHEDITLRSGGEVEELNKVEEVEEGDEELVDQVKSEHKSTSPEPEDKNEEVETILEMTFWAFVQEELSSEDIPYILEVEEPIVSFHEIKEASIANKNIKLFEDTMFKLLIEHSYRLLKKDGDKNHQPIRSWWSKVGVEKWSSFLGGNPRSISFLFPFYFFSNL